MSGHRFTDVNYLTGRRMQRVHNYAMANDREQHLKRSLKSGLKKSRDPPSQPRDDANVFAKIMREKQLLHPSTRTHRVTVEPKLDIFGIPETTHVPSVSPEGDIFGNQNRRDHLGIFGQSKYSSSYDYKRERKHRSKIKSRTTRKRETESLPKINSDYQPETYFNDYSFPEQPEEFSNSQSKKSSASPQPDPYSDASFFFFDQPTHSSSSAPKKSKSEVVYHSESPLFTTDHHESFKLNPLEENLEYIHQLIAPGSYENAKWIVDSSNLFV